MTRNWFYCQTSVFVIALDRDGLSVGEVGGGLFSNVSVFNFINNQNDQVHVLI